MTELLPLAFAAALFAIAVPLNHQLSTLNSPKPMTPHTIDNPTLRRALLGLALHGPFSLNHRRRRDLRTAISEHRNLFLALGLLLIFGGAFTSIFIS